METDPKSYFPIRAKITLGREDVIEMVKNKTTKFEEVIVVINSREDIPSGRQFKVLDTNVGKVVGR